jgi:uncharacterized protein YkwD
LKKEAKSVVSEFRQKYQEQILFVQHGTQTSALLWQQSVAHFAVYLTRKIMTNLSSINADPSATTEQNSMIDEILNAHNQYREEVDVPPLTWSETLANHAQEWADYLVSLGGLQHSQNTGEGENLWMGSSGNFSYTQMIETFGNEKQYFIGGIFPDVSSTGNWQDVGHYTQVVWKDTTEVGCAIASANGNDILVCRYSPPGNYRGQPAF